MASPFANGNGRRADGRFAPGNKAARGHGSPLGVAVAKLRAELIRAVSAADIRAIALSLKKKARGGDLKAIAILLDRLFGPSMPTDVYEEMAQLKGEIERVTHELAND